MTGKTVRLAKFLGSGKNCVIVAVDHGVVSGPIPGLLNFPQTMQQVKDADSILMNPGMLDVSGEVFASANSPLLAYRLTWISGYCEPWDYKDYHTCRILSPEQALVRGADMVTATCNIGAGDEAVDRNTIAVFSKIAEEKEKCGIPLIGEFEPNIEGKTPDEVHRLVCTVSRMLAELGADVIKTYYTGPRFAELTETVPVPVLILGSSKMEKEEYALEMASKAMKAGARGVVFGRNVFQASCPGTFLKALNDVVHNRTTGKHKSLRNTIWCRNAVQSAPLT